MRKSNQEGRKCKACLASFYRRPREKRKTFNNRDYCVACEGLYHPLRNNRPIKRICPICKAHYYNTEDVEGHCSAKCRDEYKREMDLRTAHDVLAYMREHHAEVIFSGPVKVLTAEEIAAIAHEITPYDQIGKGIVDAYHVSWMDWVPSATHDR